MPYYRQVGEVPRKRHIQFRKPDGGLYAEELMGVEGFSADSALLYHQHLPTAIVDSRVHEEPAVPLTANHPLLPRHLRTHKLDAGPADAVTGRQVRAASRHASATPCSSAVLPDPPGPSTPTIVPPGSHNQRSSVCTSRARPMQRTYSGAGRLVGIGRSTMSTHSRSPNAAMAARR